MLSGGGGGVVGEEGEGEMGGERDIERGDGRCEGIGRWKGRR